MWTITVLILVQLTLRKIKIAQFMLIIYALESKLSSTDGNSKQYFYK